MRPENLHVCKAPVDDSDVQGDSGTLVELSIHARAPGAVYNWVSGTWSTSGLPRGGQQPPETVFESQYEGVFKTLNLISAQNSKYLSETSYTEFVFVCLLVLNPS